MNRKIIFCTFAFAALLLVGCTQSNTSNPEQTTSQEQIQTQEVSQEQAQTQEQAQKLSEDDAKQIALSQVPGATEQNILEFHSDYDNGRYHYDGKIFYEQIEYEFEIDASDGTILEWDVDSRYCDVP